MVDTYLTPNMIAEGAALVSKLDSVGSSPDGALWFYFTDIGAWKLLLVQRKVGTKGPREVYKEIQKNLNALRHQITHLSLDDVSVAKPDTPMIKLLSQAISTGPGISGIRFTRNVINRVPIEDAYIYRLTKSAA